MLRESISGRIFYSIMDIPIIKLFFDFDYASQSWNKSFVKTKTEQLLEKFENKYDFNLLKRIDAVFTCFLGICPYIGLWTGRKWHIIILAVVTALYFIMGLKCRQVEFAFFYELILTALFAPFMSFSALSYILYVETAIILFFIVKNSEEKRIHTVLKIMTFLWVLQCFFTYGRHPSAVVAFMPYVLGISANRKIWGYGLRVMVLAIGFYALSKWGGEALLGGGVGILLMTVLGEFSLIIPIIIVSPWIIGIGIRMIKNGLLSENIIKTGYFFWSRSFRGATFDYQNISFGEYGVFASLVLSITAFIFFWYVLRISRQAVLRLFEKNNENKKLIRAGLGSIIGFSFYTFFSKKGTAIENVLIYLWCAGLLKRVCLGERKKEEMGVNERKKDLG